MSKFLNVVCIYFCFVYLGTSQNQSNNENLAKADFTIAFGSCNKQTKTNALWDEILMQHPNVWIWGGDIVYADTDNMEKLEANYKKQLQQNGYTDIIKMAKILGTWDDHDYGKNDAGKEFTKKKESQQLLLDFLGVPKDDARRVREGVYHSEVFETEKGNVKVILLDTRYFRTALKRSKKNKKRYEPNAYGKGTLLGELQWYWLENDLKQSNADFNIIVSSIQVLSGEHGFETWANFPHEVDKLKQLIASTNAKGVILISGDRHISEFSKIKVPNVAYPLIDFTSSGLTHSYTNFKGEPNKNRVGKVVSDISFGVIKINFETRNVTFQMRGTNNTIQQTLKQKY